MTEAGYHPIHVIGGQCAVSANPDTVFMTVLGSCVSACIYDPVAAVGGMNHFILPTGGEVENSGRQQRYGDVAMRTLVEALCNLGAMRWRLQAKLYGGRSRKWGATDPGSLNSAFARQFLQTEGIALTDCCLGEDLARWIVFQPATGMTLVRASPGQEQPGLCGRPPLVRDRDRSAAAGCGRRVHCQ
ncbi:chemotaxis protein CheD [Rhizobium terrae]|uniref:chemotaxis protein CheD n=1 Tax=Rhizobium terrae TaxID=2171756 RepID=UPI000E3B56D7|nr:chemotaxis protein CheD [Rhizobium terrae]